VVTVSHFEQTSHITQHKLISTILMPQFQPNFMQTAADDVSSMSTATTPTKNGSDAQLSKFNQLLESYSKRIVKTIENWLPRKFTQENVFSILGPQR
jgi:hypothetical protein